MADAALAVRTIEGTEAPAPGLWEIDVPHSNLGFVARYMMLTKVRGRFRDFRGAVHVAERVEDSWAELEIEAASIDTANETRDDHLRSGDFLKIEEFPKITFKSTKVEPKGGPILQVTGDLTIRGVTKPVVLDVEYLGVGKDPWGNSRAMFSANGEIDREEWGVMWNQALETGGMLVGRNVQLDLEVQAVYKGEQSS